LREDEMIKGRTGRALLRPVGEEGRVAPGVFGSETYWPLLQSLCASVADVTIRTYHVDIVVIRVVFLVRWLVSLRRICAVGSQDVLEETHGCGGLGSEKRN
jgi:hypothetical protein